RAAIADAGLMDDGFFMYSEETEWCHRFAAHGWQTRLVPSVTVTHLGGASSNQVKEETRRRMYVSIVRLYRIMYGKFGGFFPSAVAWGRFVGYRARRFAQSKGLGRASSKP
ncbi:MAG: glycosyltransferase family 2 protein, partial [Armatimonadetes bacterium]|nr:glycosyltransferase family 2 protein [Armatimonadota bacterium]